jgi:hypothetical protein
MMLDDSLLAPRSGAAAPHADGRIGDIRRDGWLYALERAMLGSGSKVAHQEPQTPEQPGTAAPKVTSGGATVASEASAKLPAADGASVPALAWLAATRPGALAAAPGVVASSPTEVALPASLNRMAGGAGVTSATAASTSLTLRDQGPCIERSASALAASASQRYGRRQLHVHVGKDGMQAWIRDADLSPAAAYRIADAFCRSTWQGGARLAALTINGKRIVGTVPGSRANDSLTAGPAASPAGDAAAAAAAAAAGRSASSHVVTEPGELAPQPGDFLHGN